MSLAFVGASYDVATAGPIELHFTIPVGTRAGDMMVVMAAQWTATPTSLVTPAGWTRVANEGLSTRSGIVFVKRATAEDEAGAGSVEVIFAPSAGRLGGALLVYRGALLDELLPSAIDSFRMTTTTGATSHFSLGTFGYHADDVRLILWNPNTDVPVTPPGGVTPRVDQPGLLVAEYAMNAPAQNNGLAGTTAGAVNMITLSATLQSRPLVTAVGIAPRHSGGIGLE